MVLKWNLNRLYAGHLIASSVVDVYSSSTGIWTTARLSSSRWALASASVSALGLALFAGGMTSDLVASDTIDIYNGVSNRWTADHLSVARYRLSAAAISVPSQNFDYFALFAGGFLDGMFSPSTL